jgi:glycosyltransferase involved in cell wall biosynthesis
MTASGLGPAVSVVMPVYNEAAFVGAAVESVLRQTMTDLELVIVDNGSTDATPEVLGRIRDPRVRVFRNERNLGSAAAGNRAVRESKAPLIARMDADDIALPHRLEIQIAALRAQPQLALLGAQACHVDVHGRRLLRKIAPRALTHFGMAWQSLFGSPIIHSTAMFTRETFEAAGGYDERMQRSSDFALFSRIQAKHRVANLRDVLVRFRHIQRPVLRDGTYDTLVRGTIEENARHFLEPHSARPEVAQMIAAWPDFCLMLRGVHMSNVRPGRATLSQYISAFRERFRELHRDPAADREIAWDAKIVLCSSAWEALSRRRPDAIRLARDSVVRAPFLASEFLVRQLAEGTFARLLKMRKGTDSIPS